MKKKLITLFFLLLAILTANFFLWNNSDRIFFVTLLAFAVFVIFIFMRFLNELVLERLKEMNKNLNMAFGQIQSLLFIYKKIDFNKALPQMRGSAISPDFASILIFLYEERKPVNIVECGSGVSTILLSYLVKGTDAKILSLDHLKKFADITAQNLREHKSGNNVKVLFSDLKEYKIKDRLYNWYDLDKVKNMPSNIDMLIIDGPPRNLNKNVRYPALALLYDRLAENCVIILDDADRKDEKEVVKRWLMEFPEFKKTYIPTEKGTVILER